jgi:hypothetical protein
LICKRVKKKETSEEHHGSTTNGCIPNTGNEWLKEEHCRGEAVIDTS